MFFIILIIYDNNVQSILKVQTFFQDWYNGTMDRLPLGIVIQIDHATVMSTKVTRSLNVVKEA